MLPANNIISVEEVIARCKVGLRIQDTSEWDSFLEILIREGLGSLNCINQLQKKQCTMTLEDGKIKLPKDLVRFLALRPKSWLPSTEENPITSNFPGNCGRFIYADTTFLDSCGCDNLGFRNFNSGFQINNGFIHFNSEVDIDEATIAYLGMWLDADGKPAIFERFERALTAYACWKFTRSWPEKYNQYIMSSYQTEWVNQREKLKGMAVKDEFEQNRVFITGMMRSLIVSSTVNIL
jgi:hypothetical protein